MGKVVKLNRDLVGRSIVSKALAGPHRKRRKSGTSLPSKLGTRGAKGQTRLMVRREVFESFVMLHLGNVLWLEMMRGGVGMPQLESTTSRVLGPKLSCEFFPRTD